MFIQALILASALAAAEPLAPLGQQRDASYNILEYDSCYGLRIPGAGEQVAGLLVDNLEGHGHQPTVITEAKMTKV